MKGKNKMDRNHDHLPVLPSTTTTSPAVLLTPGRTRNIAQDMEALRLSRHDNPYLQQVMASRESLIESHADECDSDDTILMSQDFVVTPLESVEEDPLTLKEVHEHMIRSPPPISCWPHDPLSHRTASAFDFGSGGGSAGALSYSTYSVDAHHDKDFGSGRSPRRVKGFDISLGRARNSRSASPRAHDFSIGGRPLSLPGESHLRNALGRKQSNQPSERFSLLQQRIGRRNDSERLVNCDD